MQELLDNYDLVLMEAAIVERLRRNPAVELGPVLVNAGLIYDEAGRRELQKLYLEYLQVAADAALPFLMFTPTWRTNSERVKLAKADPRINSDVVQFLLETRESANAKLDVVKIGGMVGCKNDCYLPAEALSRNDAERFHAWQIDQLAGEDVDFLIAVTLPSVEEAIGMARAMASTERPYMISFVIDRLGNVLDGTPILDAIKTIDEASNRLPLGYLVNCAYPSFLCAAEQPTELFSRLIGFQGNASSADHAELDGSTELRMDSLNHWGDEMLLLNQQFGVKMLGGCCGTGVEHLRYITENFAFRAPSGLGARP